MTELVDCWAVVPAAGSGTRMAAGLPKQYLEIGSKTILEHTLERMLQLRCLRGVVVVLGDGDRHWHRLSISRHPRIRVAKGGAQRVDSVRNGLLALASDLADDNWVMVHDAARPCVRVEDLLKMLRALGQDPVGGILGVPVNDTIKQVAEGGLIQRTVDRNGLWRAYTPQMFRYRKLLNALESAIEKGIVVTDEASAMEAAGYTPRMVEGHADNLKVTHADDLRIAEVILGCGARTAGESH